MESQVQNTTKLTSNTKVRIYETNFTMKLNIKTLISGTLATFTQAIINESSSWLCFAWFDSLFPINNLSVIKRQVFLGWTSFKLGLMCRAQGHNTEMPVRLEPTVSSQALYHWATALPKVWVDALMTNLKLSSVTCHTISWHSLALLF